MAPGMYKRKTYRRRYARRGYITRRSFKSALMDKTLHYRRLSNAPMTFKLRVRNPNGHFVASGGTGIAGQVAQTNDPSLCTDFTALQSLYDTYKVSKVKFQYYPTFCDNQLVGGAGTTQFHPMYVFYDPDSTTNVASVDAALQYDNCKVFNLFRPISYYISNIVSTDNSVSTAGMRLNYRKGRGVVLDINTPANYQRGVIGWYADTLPINTTFGDIVVTYYVTCYDRR